MHHKTRTTVLTTGVAVALTLVATKAEANKLVVESSTTVATAPLLGSTRSSDVAMILDSQDNPVIAYVESDNTLQLVRCADRDCNSSVNVELAANAAIVSPELAVNSNDNPHVLYLLDDPNATYDQLWVAYCEDVNCQTVGQHQISNGATRVGPKAIDFDVNDNFLVAYQHIWEGLGNIATVIRYTTNPHPVWDDLIYFENVSPEVDGDFVKGKWHGGSEILLSQDANGIPTFTFMPELFSLELSTVTCDDVPCHSWSEDTTVNGPTPPAIGDAFAVDPRNQLLIRAGGWGFEEVWYQRCLTPDCSVAGEVMRFDDAGGINHETVVFDNGDIALGHAGRKFNATNTRDVIFCTAADVCQTTVLEAAEQGDYDSDSAFGLTSDQELIHAYFDRDLVESNQAELKVVRMVREDVPWRHGTVDDVTDAWFDVTFDSETSSIPVVIADMQTKVDGDPAGLRMDVYATDGFSVFVEEEASVSSDLSHGQETVGYFAIPAGILYDAGGNAIGEAGTVTTDQSDADAWHTLSNLQLNYTNPVVRMTMNSYAGGQPAHIRLDVSGNTIQYQIEEWEYLNGTHTTETIAYVIVEEGQYDLSDGTTLQAQTTSINHNFSTVQFAQAYTGTPVVFSQSQTENGNDPIVTRQRSISSSSVQIQLQEEDGMDVTHTNETVGVISIGQ